VSVFTLDFAGSGLSAGQYVTLGALEADDLEVAVAYLRERDACSTLGLWGRSMGAVTALLYSQRDPSIAGMVGAGAADLPEPLLLPAAAAAEPPGRCGRQAAKALASRGGRCLVAPQARRPAAPTGAGLAVLQADGLDDGDCGGAAAAHPSHADEASAELHAQVGAQEGRV
jgi:alpha-beta hydrolase superfamily lysophospholipase